MELLSAEQIARAGEKIYREKYRAEYERRFRNRFVAIEIDSGDAFVAKTAEAAIAAAEKARDGGLFHLIKIGAPGAYHVSGCLS